MDLKRRFSTGDIDPKVSRSAIGRSEFSPKLAQFKNSLLTTTTTTTTTESNRGRTMSSTENVVKVVSPLKRKSSQIEMTSLHQCDAKRRRHHRRKPNKKWRHKSVTAEKSKSVCQNSASSTTTTTATAAAATAKCQKDRKLNGSANSNNCSSACQLLWKKKRKHPFFHQNSGAAITGTTSGSGGQHNNTLQSQRLAGHGGGAGRKRTNDVVLRPTKVPLLNAPRNSTQFIIDDHESSDLVWNFETRTTVPRQQQPPKEVSAPVESDTIEDSASTSPPAVRRRISSDCENLFTSSRSGGGGDDEDTFWLEFSERDFQSVYETAHQEEIAEWDRKKLVEEIASLERRHKELVKVLARLDPQVYVSRLQRELGKLQEQNRILKSSVATTTTREPEVEINEVAPGVEKADEEPDSNEKCKSTSQDETLPDSTND